MKTIYLFLTICLSCISLRVNCQGVTRYTPTGVNVYATKNIEWASDEEIAAANVWWQDSIIRANWNAEILAPCSSVYNCHGYAWHMSDGGDTIWMPYDYDVSRYYTGNGSQIATYKRVDNPAKYKKVYYNGASHSAIVDPYNSSMVISKWGCGPLVRHKPGDAPYDNYTLEYYELIIDDTPASVAKGCAVNVSTRNISGANI